ncbi:MAG: hypothetical protein C0187_06170 [Calditerrivibrio nitroreducens]|uniref:Uncharacterized protein n=1 Tax=Calditerrivibrio nitroreducens TaxID=477976 RepID=A0A2J6WI14_9BACT|nr:MAG: hypothetical protein C0187_06170 [Calditerrivibrio nitroreducens]
MKKLFIWSMVIKAGLFLYPIQTKRFMRKDLVSYLQAKRQNRRKTYHLFVLNSQIFLIYLSKKIGQQI